MTLNQLLEICATDEEIRAAKELYSAPYAELVEIAKGVDTRARVAWVLVNRHLIHCSIVAF